MRNEVTTVGAAPNVDLREVQDVEAAADRRRHRIIDVTCLTCTHCERIHVQPGDSRTVDHEREQPAHVVEYVEVDR